MACAIVFCGGLRRLLSFYYLELRAPDRGVSAWKVREGRSVSSPWPESAASLFFLTPFSSASGLVTAVDSTMLVPSSHPLLAPYPLSVSPFTFPPVPEPSHYIELSKFFLCRRSVPTAEDLVFFLRSVDILYIPVVDGPECCEVDRFVVFAHGRAPQGNSCGSVIWRVGCLRCRCALEGEQAAVGIEADAKPTT